MDREKIAEELLRVARDLVSVQLPSEEKGGKPQYDADFKANYVVKMKKKVEREG